ncbi:BEN domain-containing protein 5-like [Temnothorax curvispinosus]|uniref:BEN domain-containing protein 5-like n=1 Tax=Temnothorax curvispinosus TaxID=300111 RepID=A0A6J1PRN0_9HYME|nr:BEN domain-containing protein 5-like [Temnothorax curvispinosus]
MFAYMKFAAPCARHEDKDIVKVNKIKSFNKANWHKNKYYKVQCGETKCQGLIIFVEDSLEEAQAKICKTKRIIVLAKNRIEEADDTTTTDTDAGAIIKNKKDQSADIRTALHAKIKNISKSAGGNMREKEKLSSPKQLISTTTNESRKRNNLDSSSDKLAKKAKLTAASHANLEKELKGQKLHLLEKDGEIKRLTLLLEEATSLNNNLQHKVISYFNKFKATADKLDELKSRKGANTLPVGYIRKSNGTIHLGRDIWLSTEAYNSAVAKPRSLQIVVKNLALAVYGLKTLMESSVSRHVSNKYRNRAPKKKLDDRRMLAIQDIYRYWLVNEKKLPAIEVDIECRNVPHYISKKISDLNRDTDKTKGIVAIRKTVRKGRNRTAQSRVNEAEEEDVEVDEIKEEDVEEEDVEEEDVEEEDAVNGNMELII